MGFYRNIRIKIRKCQEENDKYFNNLIHELDKICERISEKLEKQLLGKEEIRGVSREKLD